MFFLFRPKIDPIAIQRAKLEEEIEQVKREMNIAYNNFEYVIDPDLIDSCIYEVNSVQKRYRYLLKQLTALEPQS